MYLFLVSYTDGLHQHNTYVLADTFDQAVAAVGAPLADITDVQQLGEPVIAAAARFPSASQQGLVSAVPIGKSVGKNWIYSLEDGKAYKTLKRHLSTRGMTPEQYRAKWGLPPDYPMVAPSYAAVRSKLAKARGLGRK